MDGGIDDALALILALRSPKLEVAGISAVSGNVPVEQATINALRVVELLERTDVWVAKGLANPLIRDPIRATDYHGLDGLGDSNLPQPSARPSEKSALDIMSEEIAGTKNRLSFIATGPLTNVAALFTKEPDIPHMLEEVVIMGGAYGVTEYGIGNETPVAEFNIYSDPEAAKIVFESGVALRAVGLDVTMIPNAQLSMKEYVRISRSKTKAATFVSRILANTMRKWKRFALHDPMAVAAKAKSSIFKFEKFPAKVETKGEYTDGMTVVDRRSSEQNDKSSGPKIGICTGIVSRQFKQMVLQSIV